MDANTDTQRLMRIQGHERAPDSSPLKRRAPLACRNCNLRKVRCNVTSSGGRSCANCIADGITCEVVPRKKRKSRENPSITPSVQRDGQRESTTPLHLPGGPSINLRGSHAAPIENTNQTQSFQERNLASDTTARTGSRPSEAAPTRGSSEQDEGDNADAFAIGLDPNVPPGGNASLFFTGEKHGAMGFIGDIVDPGGSQGEHHYLVPRASKKTKKSEDLSYLRIKGAFSTPSKELCDALICTYFRHVHPLLPIIDAQSFLDQYLRHGCQNINLLLLWSMFLAASNFVEPQVLQNSGYKSRKAMKRAMFQRAKCLYDSDYEEDTISLIQSVILLGFWYTDTEDRTGAWHWIGIAISLCQTLGLYRSPESVNASRRVSETQQRLFRRIWWSCFIRDRWLSLVKGRPMRINIEDCDLPLPFIEDITNELNALPSTTKDRYIPYDSHAVACLWIKLVKISVALGSILRIHYRSNGLKATVEDIERCEEEIHACALTAAELEQSNENMQLLSYQLQLFYEATIIVLYRPYVLRGPVNILLDIQSLWQRRALDRARSAATNTNKVLEELIHMDMVRFLKPMTITCLIPAMQIHLLDCKSPLSLFRRLGNLKLQLCMMILSELKETYWGADFTLHMFERALAKLSEGAEGRGQSGQGNTSQRSVPGSGIAPMTPESTAVSQPRGTEAEYPSYPSIEDILTPGFSLGEGPYPFWTNEIELNSVQDIEGDFSINSLLSSEEFNGFCRDIGL